MRPAALCYAVLGGPPSPTAPPTRRSIQQDAAPGLALAWGGRGGREEGGKGVGAVMGMGAGVGETGWLHAGLPSPPLPPSPVKNWGNLTGRMTASFSASLAPSKPATSSHCAPRHTSQHTHTRCVNMQCMCCTKHLGGCLLGPPLGVWGEMGAGHVRCGGAG